MRKIIFISIFIFTIFLSGCISKKDIGELESKIISLEKEKNICVEKTEMQTKKNINYEKQMNSLEEENNTYISEIENSKKDIVFYKNNILKIEEKVENDFFSKNQECNKLYNDLNTRLESYSKTSNYNFTLEEVFYSPKLNKCLYIDLFEDPLIFTIKRLMSV